MIVEESAAKINKCVYNSKALKCAKVGAEMKWIRYSFAFFICGLVIITTGCQKDHVSVVNTGSGVVIHSSDFTTDSSYQNKHKSKTQVNGRLIKMGGESSGSDFGPSFDFDKLN